MTATPATTPKPFLRWAGGKRRLLGKLKPALPKTFGKLYEPFVGGGALTFDLAQDVAGSRLVLGDVNEELICAWRIVRDDVDSLITELEKMAAHTSEQAYYAARWSQPVGDLQRAVRMIYLNKTCFNGLYRVNSKGEFNVPWGKLANPLVCDAELLKADSKRLQGAQIDLADFATSTQTAQEGDFVYFDPPYLPASPTASFSKYAAGDFRKPEHEQLAETIKDLTSRGVYVMLSNADTKLTRDIYDSLDLYSVTVHRSIAAAGGNRGSVDEVVGVNYAKTTMRAGSEYGTPLQARTGNLLI